jgi:hypothetical protein
VSIDRSLLWGFAFTLGLACAPLEEAGTQDGPPGGFAPIMPDGAPSGLVHPGYAAGPPSMRWMLGEHSRDADQRIVVPDRGDVIAGTDLGASVSLGARTFFYLGDSFWPGRVECSSAEFSASRMMSSACARNVCCNDAIAFTEDDDPTDGVDLAIPTHRTRSGEESFLPLVIAGIHDDPDFLGGLWRGNRDPNYTAPGGAGLATGLPGRDGPQVMLWYTTSVWPQGHINRAMRPFRAPRSFVAVSGDGVTFAPLVADAQGTPLPFSFDEEGAPAKFLCTSPVEVTAGQLRRICEGPDPGRTGEPSILCSLEPERRAAGGMLVFGSGRNYRLSPLYLAFLSYAHLGRGREWDLRYLGRDARGGWEWKSEEQDAYPIIGAEYAENRRFREECVERTAFWRCAAAVRDAARAGEVDAAEDLFGELSVKLITDGPAGMAPTLVMLSNHQRSPRTIAGGNALEERDHLKTYMREGDVLYRTASLDAPHRWSQRPRKTGASGYGPYIIDRYTRYDAKTGELELWHVLSLWKGPAMSDDARWTQYGVATVEARIPWPAQGAR